MSVKLNYACEGGNFDVAGEASAKIKKTLQRIGIPADVVRRIAIGTYEAEMNVIIHAGGGNVCAEVFPDKTIIHRNVRRISGTSFDIAALSSAGSLIVPVLRS